MPMQEEVLQPSDTSVNEKDPIIARALQIAKEYPKATRNLQSWIESGLQAAKELKMTNPQIAQCMALELLRLGIADVDACDDIASIIEQEKAYARNSKLEREQGQPS